MRLCPVEDKDFPILIVNILGADDLATQAATASASKICTMLSRIKLDPARKG